MLYEQVLGRMADDAFCVTAQPKAQRQVPFRRETSMSYVLDSCLSPGCSRAWLINGMPQSKWKGALLVDSPRIKMRFVQRLYMIVLQRCSGSVDFEKFPISGCNFARPTPLQEQHDLFQKLWKEGVLSGSRA